MTVVRRDSQQLLHNSSYTAPSGSSVSEPASNTKLWIGHQGESGVSNIRIQATDSEIFVELELTDIDCNHLLIQASPDLLLLSGILYGATDDPATPNLGQPSEPSYQPQSFRDLIPLPYPVSPESAIATLSRQCLRITLPLGTKPQTLASSGYHLNTLPIRPAQIPDRLCMSDLLTPNHW
jgi:HSP20 family molecular chaperone IbpA